MSKVAIQGNASGTGTFSIVAPNGNTDRTITLPDRSGNVLVDAPVFRVSRATSQTFASNTATKIGLPTKMFDTDSAFDAVTNNRFQPVLPGYYQINYSVYCDMQSQGASLIQLLTASLYKNGSVYDGSDLGSSSLVYNTSAPATVSAATGADIVYMNGTTDYLELWARVVVSSGTPTITRAWMGGHFVRNT